VPYNSQWCILILRYIFFFIEKELLECASARAMRIVILDVTLFFIAVVKFGARVGQFKGLLLLNNNNRRLV
jgi:hypothetical protein